MPVKKQKPPAVFESLKEALADLTKVRALSLKAQKLKKLPASILKLTALERLDLSNNALDDVPEPILSLEKLKSLDLTGNDLRSRLPRLAKLAKLPNLEELGLGYHLHWKTLPSELFGLTQLRRLDLSWLTIKAIPDELSRLSELEALDLSSCTGLKKLPSAVLGLRKLRQLTLSRSPIGTVPTGIGALEELRELALAETGIRALPESIGRLTKLESLEIGDNVHLTTLPSSIGALTSLRVLRFSPHYSAKKPVVLPPEVGKLPLEVLTLAYAHLTEIPAPVFALGSLVELNLLNNAIRYDARAFKRLAKLPSLKTLLLQRNPDLTPRLREIRAMLPGVKVSG